MESHNELMAEMTANYHQHLNFTLNTSLQMLCLKHALKDYQQEAKIKLIVNYIAASILSSKITYGQRVLKELDSFPSRFLQSDFLNQEKVILEKFKNDQINLFAHSLELDKNILSKVLDLYLSDESNQSFVQDNVDLFKNEN